MPVNGKRGQVIFLSLAHILKYMFTLTDFITRWRFAILDNRDWGKEREKVTRVSPLNG